MQDALNRFVIMATSLPWTITYFDDQYNCGNKWTHFKKKKVYVIVFNLKKIKGYVKLNDSLEFHNLSFSSYKPKD